MELKEKFRVKTIIKITGEIKRISGGMYECRWSDGDKTEMSRQEVKQSFADGLWELISETE